MENDGVNPNEHELRVLAYRIAARMMRDAELDWEDYPMLTEEAFDQLNHNVNDLVSRVLLNNSRIIEDTYRIDHAALLEKVRG